MFQAGKVAACDEARAAAITELRQKNAIRPRVNGGHVRELQIAAEEPEHRATRPVENVCRQGTPLVDDDGLGTECSEGMMNGCERLLFWQAPEQHDRRPSAGGPVA